MHEKESFEWTNSYNMYFLLLKATFKGWMEIMYAAVDSRSVSKAALSSLKQIESHMKLWFAHLSVCNVLKQVEEQPIKENSLYMYLYSSSSSSSAPSSRSISSSVSSLTISNQQKRKISIKTSRIRIMHVIVTVIITEEILCT